MPGITPIDSSIPLALKDPVTTYGELMKAKDTDSQARYRDAQAPLVRQQTALAEQQTQAATLANQQTQMDMDDQRKIKDYLSADPANAEKFGRGDMSGVQGLGVRPKNLMAAQTWANTSRTAAVKLDTETLQNKAAEAGRLKDLIESVRTVKDPAERKERALNGFMNGQRNGDFKGMSFPANFDGSDASMDAVATQNGLSRGMLDAELKRREAEADLATKQAAAPKAQAEMQKALADADKARQDIEKGKQDVFVKQQQQYAGLLANAAKQGPSQLAAAQAMLPAEHQAAFAGVTKPEDILDVARTPEERVKSKETAAALANTQRHQLSEESTSRLQANIAAGHLAQTQMVNNMKYGPDTREYWVQQLQQNPDSIKELPPEMRTAVGKQFTAVTGLPLPMAAPVAAQAQEMAARNALDGADFIKKAMQNPEIRANIGPILGRLGNVEQAIGTAGHLSPEAAQLAQELRTRMRYFVFQEGKAVLGGRLPQQLMTELESSSASPKMDSPTLAGALNGAVGNARSVIDNVERSRFGGQVRPDSVRHLPSIATGGAPAAGTVEGGFRFRGGNPADKANWERVAQ